MRSNFRTLSERLHLSLALVLLPLVGMMACDSNSSRPAKVTGPAAAVATTSYQAEGHVIALVEQRPSIKIDHQEIKGLMPAMTMEFMVKDKALLAGIQNGDTIEFTIENGVGGLMITSIRKK